MEDTNLYSSVSFEYSLPSVLLSHFMSFEVFLNFYGYLALNRSNSSTLNGCVSRFRDGVTVASGDENAELQFDADTMWMLLFVFCCMFVLLFLLNKHLQAPIWMFSLSHAQDKLVFLFLSKWKCLKMVFSVSIVDVLDSDSYAVLPSSIIVLLIVYPLSSLLLLIFLVVNLSLEFVAIVVVLMVFFWVFEFLE